MKEKKGKQTLGKLWDGWVDKHYPGFPLHPEKSWSKYLGLKAGTGVVRGTFTAIKGGYYAMTPEKMPDPRYDDSRVVYEQLCEIGSIDIEDAAETIYAKIPKPLSTYRQLIRDLITPELTPPDLPSDDPIAHAAWRDAARRFILTANSGKPRIEAPILKATQLISAHLPPPSSSGIRVPILDLIPDIPKTLEAVIKAFYENYPSLRDKLDANSLDDKGDLVLPTKSKLPARDLPQKYLRGLPLLQLFTARIPFAIPVDKRFEHAWVLSGTGFGKTTLLAGFIKDDIEAIRRGERSAVVIDSQNVIIPNLAWVDVPKVIIDPKDVDHPLALNIFDAGLENAHSKEHYQSLLNGAINMFGFIIGSLFEQPMTPRQKGVFDFIAEFLITDVPHATIEDFQTMLDPKKAVEKFEKIWRKSRPPIAHFFTEEFKQGEVRKTLHEVAPRLRPLLRNPAFANLFSAPTSKFLMPDEINKPQLILINADKSFLQPDGCKIFERFWISQINQSALRRSAETKKLPCHVYIDECQDGLEGGDKQIENILDQARKQSIGLMLLHHRTNQFRSDSLVEALDGSTSIKLTGKLTSSDLPRLAKMMNTTQEHLLSQKRRETFALYVDAITPQAITMKFPNTVFAKELSADQFSVMLKNNRDKYCYSPQPQPAHSETSDERDDDDDIDVSPSKDY